MSAVRTQLNEKKKAISKLPIVVDGRFRYTDLLHSLYIDVFLIDTQDLHLKIYSQFIVYIY